MVRRNLHYILIIALCACTGSRPKSPKAAPPDVLPALNTPQGIIGCEKMMDDYCAFLYSPETLGNLQVPHLNESLKVLQGETENDFPQVYYRYAKAKLNNKDYLPADFRKALNNYNYFGLLKRSLERKPRTKMTFSERLEAERLDATLDSEWTASINETVWTRLAKQFPGVHQLSDREMPPEYEIEAKKIRRALITEISKTLWHNDRNWKKVEDTFLKLKVIFTSMIDSLDLDDNTRASWKRRIASMKLALPGSTSAIADDECSTTTINAYYYRYLDVITVCAGDFNSEDILLTLTHEMSHALDISRSIYLHKVKSALGVAQADLRENICRSQTEFDCGKWDDFKSNFTERVQNLNVFRYDLPEFNRCLKRKPTKKSPNTDDLTRIAHTLTVNRYSNLATNGYFLRIIKKKIPLRNGRLNQNPYYLDPCKYYLWSHAEEPPEEELSSLVYFTAEYRCSSPTDPDRFRKAIEVSRNMTEKLLYATLKLEGEFSASELMEREGFSSSPIERFADVLGSFAMSEFLQSAPHITDRRARFLAGSAWQCSEPSLTSRYPDESRVENEYSFTHHAEGLERRREILSEPMRVTLNCERDFEFNECPIPLRNH